MQDYTGEKRQEVKFHKGFHHLAEGGEFTFTTLRCGEFSFQKDTVTFGQSSGGSRGGCRRRAPPLRVQILSFWHTNFSKRSRLGSWRPPTGNPGSATAKGGEIDHPLVTFTTLQGGETAAYIFQEFLIIKWLSQYARWTLIVFAKMNNFANIGVTFLGKWSFVSHRIPICCWCCPLESSERNAKNCGFWWKSVVFDENLQILAENHSSCSFWV